MFTLGKADKITNQIPNKSSFTNKVGKELIRPITT